jgi:hypothetical protein
MLKRNDKKKMPFFIIEFKVWKDIDLWDMRKREMVSGEWGARIGSGKWGGQCKLRKLLRFSVFLSGSQWLIF